MDYKEMKELAEWLAAKFDGAVTGSIMLKERGIDLGREPGDIDILVREMPDMPADLYKALAGEKDPMPIRYEELSEDGRKRDTWYGRKRRVMINGVKVDFLLADDDRMGKSDMLGKARYADVDGLVKAKEHYLKVSKKPEYIQKTEKDLAMIYAKLYLKRTPEDIRKWVGQKGIRCVTNFNALKVLAVFDALGIRWIGGNEPLDFVPHCPTDIFVSQSGLSFSGISESDNHIFAQEFLDYCYGKERPKPVRSNGEMDKWLKNKAVHCKTEEEAKQVLEVADMLGYRWTGGGRFTDNSFWGDCKDNTCYGITDGIYGSLEYFRVTGRDVISAQEFLDYRYGKKEPEQPKPVRTKEEMDKWLKNKVVICKTEEEAKQVLEAADKLGYMWRVGKKFTESTHWAMFRDATCYNIVDGGYNVVWLYARNSIRIISAQNFLDYCYGKREPEQQKPVRTKAEMDEWLGNKTVHCKTEEEAKQVLEVADSLGYRWVGGERFTENSRWELHKSDTCYYIADGSYSSLGYFKLTARDVISAQDFLDYCNVDLRSAGEVPSVESILEEASRIVAGERNADYGDPVENFGRIAEAAKALGVDITPVDCCKVLMAVKIARERHCHKRDNLVDLAGYAHILELLENAKAHE